VLETVLSYLQGDAQPHLLALPTTCAEVLVYFHNTLPEVGQGVLE
jgi:hypothetical protein